MDEYAKIVDSQTDEIKKQNEIMSNQQEELDELNNQFL